MIEQVRRKWSWAGHVSRIRDNRWTPRVTTWKPYERKRPGGRPAIRWRDVLDDYWKGTIWVAQDIQHDKAFAQPRDTYYGYTMTTTMMMTLLGKSGLLYYQANINTLSCSQLFLPDQDMLLHYKAFITLSDVFNTLSGS